MELKQHFNLDRALTASFLEKIIPLDCFSEVESLEAATNPYNFAVEFENSDVAIFQISEGWGHHYFSPYEAAPFEAKKIHANGRPFYRATFSRHFPGQKAPTPQNLDFGGLQKGGDSLIYTIHGEFDLNKVRGIYVLNKQTPKKKNDIDWLKNLLNI